MDQIKTGAPAHRASWEHKLSKGHETRTETIEYVCVEAGVEGSLIANKEFERSKAMNQMLGEHSSCWEKPQGSLLLDAC